MSYLKIWLLLLACLGMGRSATGQILPADFECIKDDTLFWSPTSNNCGPFVSIDVYKSFDRSGPYQLLTSITDPNATWHVDDESSAAYYYILSNHNCPGQNVISSDTFSNQFQQFVTKIKSVSVVGGDVEITWNENGSDQTVGYIVYRITPQGTLPIDTVFNGLSYLDQSASPGERIESYYVLGMNACGGTNTFDALPHSTILLNAEMNFCEQHIRLTWNKYEAWENDVENNQIWLGIDGEQLAFEHQISGDDTLAYITGVQDESTYCISIIAKENGRSIESSSNVVCVTTDVLSPLQSLIIHNVSVNVDGEVEIDWSANSNADLSSLDLLRGDAPTGMVNLSGINLPLDSDNHQSIDAMALVQSQPYFYQLGAIDDCDTAHESNFISTIHARLLSAKEGENQIAWTPLESSGRIVTGYEVCRVANGMETSIGQAAVDQLFIADEVPVSARDQVNCYVIKAMHTNESGTDLRIARSNILCVEQEVDLYIPNAFVPNGNNPVFKPSFLNRPQSGYQLTIFNRWGGLVFETNNTEAGWDGLQEGSECPAGVYIYLIQFTQPDGSAEVFRGDLHLIR